MIDITTMLVIAPLNGTHDASPQFSSPFLPLFPSNPIAPPCPSAPNLLSKKRKRKEKKSLGIIRTSPYACGPPKNKREGKICATKSATPRCYRDALDPGRSPTNSLSLCCEPALCAAPSSSLNLELSRLECWLVFAPPPSTSRRLSGRLSGSLVLVLLRVRLCPPPLFFPEPDDTVLNDGLVWLGGGAGWCGPWALRLRGDSL